MPAKKTKITKPYLFHQSDFSDDYILTKDVMLFTTVDLNNPSDPSSSEEGNNFYIN